MYTKQNALADALVVEHKSLSELDVVHCFEPQHECYKLLQQKFSKYLDDRLILYNFGLVDFDGEKSLYGVGDNLQDFWIGASKIEQCKFIRASSFFAEQIAKDDLTIMKLNCEGGEVPILRNLTASDEIHKLTNVMIDFDIRKTPRQEHEQKNIIAELKEVGFDKYYTERIMIGPSHGERCQFWLSTLLSANHIM